MRKREREREAARSDRNEHKCAEKNTTTTRGTEKKRKKGDFFKDTTEQG